MIKRFLFSLFVSHVTHAYESYKPKLNENCVDDIIGKICNEQCVGILVQCTIGCESDSVCISNCAREEAKCIDSCPCHTECYDGCDGCDHYLCNQCEDVEANEDFHRCEDTLANELAQCLAACGGSSSCIIGCSSNYETDLKNCPCMEGCPQGCPCAEYDCSFIPTTTTSTTTTTTT